MGTCHGSGLGVSCSAIKVSNSDRELKANNVRCGLGNSSFVSHVSFMDLVSGHMNLVAKHQSQPMAIETTLSCCLLGCFGQRRRGIFSCKKLLNHRCRWLGVPATSMSASSETPHHQQGSSPLQHVENSTTHGDLSSGHLRLRGLHTNVILLYAFLCFDHRGFQCGKALHFVLVFADLAEVASDLITL